MIVWSNKQIYEKIILQSLFLRLVLVILSDLLKYKAQKNPNYTIRVLFAQKT